MKRRAVLAVHAGAGDLTRSRMAARSDPSAETWVARVRASISECLRLGHQRLVEGASAVDAVEAAVTQLEDDELFNAGLGSVLTSRGEVEMDACIMDGQGRNAGAVACVRRIANPVGAARRVLEESAHVLLVGEGAERFAFDRGIPLCDPGQLVTDARRGQLERARSREEVRLDHDEPINAGRGTVGAVALDRLGHLAAATSTGGMTNQLPGRVGDTPIVGAGTWADDASCAVSGTGDGEAFLRCAFAHEVATRLMVANDDAQGDGPLERAVDAALEQVTLLNTSGGCVSVDVAGRVALRFTTAGMVRGWIGDDAKARIAVFGDEDPA